MEEKLNSKPSKNQGFVLDGFPKTYEQAKMIFSGRFHQLFESLYNLLKSLSHKV